jgi:hypothetical protein
MSVCGLPKSIRKESKYILLSRTQNAGQYYDIKIAHRSSENVAQFKYLRTTVTNQNLIQEEIKKRLNSGKAWYHSVQNFLFSRLQSKNVKIRIYTSIILPVVPYGCKTWSLTLREERRLRVFENRTLSRIFGPKRDEVTGGWRNLYALPRIIRIMKSWRIRCVGYVARMGEDECI